MNEKILIVGGAGYVGTKLAPYLIDKSYDISVIDWMIYGNYLPDIPIYKIDMRNTSEIEKAIKKIEPEIVVDLAAISNDPMGNVLPSLTIEINDKAQRKLIDICKENNIKKFIFASSASVYGINDKENISEDVKLAPISVYSRTKTDIEKYLMKVNSDDFCTVRIRPATVCGYSPRQRLDLIVNLLTYHGFFNKKIRIEGGERIRPFIHIDDMVNAYHTFIKADADIISGEVYNCGSEYISLNGLGDLVKKYTNCDINYTDGPDKRSHRLNSEKIKKELNFKFEKNIESAIKDLINVFEKGILDIKDPRLFNLNWYKKLIEENKIK